MAEYFKEVFPQKRLAAREEDVVNAVSRALVQDFLPSARVELALRERRVFVPDAVAVRTAEVALRRKLKRHVMRIPHYGLGALALLAFSGSAMRYLPMRPLRLWLSLAALGRTSGFG